LGERYLDSGHRLLKAPLVYLAVFAAVNQLQDANVTVIEAPFERIQAKSV
jgi:hypothetical protein